MGPVLGAALLLSIVILGPATSLPAIRPRMPMGSGLVADGSRDIARKLPSNALSTSPFDFEEPGPQGPLAAMQASRPAVQRSTSNSVLRCKSFGDRSTAEYQELAAQLWVAAQRGDTSECFNLVKQGVWPNHLLENERFQGSALHVAAMHGHVEACELLVRLGADVHLRQKQGLTPLHVAAQFGHEKAVRQLLVLGADSTTKCALGDTPAHKAWLGGYESLKRLLQTVESEERASALRFRQRTRGY